MRDNHVELKVRNSYILKHNVENRNTKSSCIGILTLSGDVKIMKRHDVKGINLNICKSQK